MRVIPIWSCLFVSVAIAFSGLPILSHSQERKTPTASEAKLRLDVFRSKSREPLNDLQEKYDRVLGELETGKMYDLEIRVTKDKVRIYVNRRKRAEVKGYFAAAEGKIGLGPAFGSTLTVEHFKGVQE